MKAPQQVKLDEDPHIAIDRSVPLNAIDLLSALVNKRRSRVREYSYAVLFALVALASRLWIAPLDGGIQYVTFFPAVALAALFGGLRPGLLVAGIGCLLATYLFWPPYQTFAFAFQHAMVVSNIVFLIDAFLISAGLEAMHRLHRRACDTEQQLRLAASVFEKSNEGVMVTNADGLIQAVNPAFTQITGYLAEEAVGQKPSLLRSDRQHPTFYRAMWEKLTSEGRWDGELWNRRKSGEAYLVSLSISAIRDDHGRPTQYVGVFHDITTLRARDAQVQHLAFHDALTGLPNRALFEDRLRHALARAERDKGRLALAFIDLDGFKPVNDTFGHDVGDMLLREVAQRIKGRIRAMDTAARLGGDEFVILIEDGRREDCAELSRHVLDAISRPMTLGEHCVSVSASIGIAVFPEDGATDIDLMKAADIAMYRAKAAGRGNAGPDPSVPIVHKLREIRRGASKRTR